MGALIGIIILFAIIGGIFKAIGAFFAATWHWWLIGVTLIILIVSVVIVVIKIRNKRYWMRSNDKNECSSITPIEIVKNPPIFPPPIKQQEEVIDYTFKEKAIMTRSEVIFYGKLQKAVVELFGTEMIIYPQIVLSSIISKIYMEKWKDYQSELNYVVDYVLVDTMTQKVKLIIELNDDSHYRTDRWKRDKKVESLCQTVGYSFVCFWLNDKNKKPYPNTIEYIKKRMLIYL